jgi:hypothetical protein
MVQCPLCGHRFQLNTDQSAVEVSGAGRTLFVFQREGEYWFIGYEADTFRLKDTKGLRYLHTLLGNPGREILALDLVQYDEGGFSARSNAPRLQREDGLRLFMPGDGGEVIDRSARVAYERRVRDLADEVEDAEASGDAERAALLHEELDFIVEHLAAATGLAGATRHTVSPAERARQSVTKAMKSAAARISGHSPALGRHLASTIRTGTYCIYQPDPRVPTSWRL